MTEISCRIALADDDPSFAEILIEYYKPRKIHFDHFLRADQLLSVLRGSAGEAPPYDLILTDLMMPEMDGIEFTKHLKNIHPDLPVIVTTASSDVSLAIKAIEAGADDYIVKPIHFPHLNVVLQRALHFSQIKKENEALKRRFDRDKSGLGLIAKSPSVMKAVTLAKQVANSEATVLLTGESGTGKEVFARLIHRSSKRADKPFVPINCSAIPENLLESELFGHAKGSFTGADAARIGIFEEANGGTLFLDEIGDIPFHLQAKLLRVIQERKIKRIGENVYRDIDVRIIAASLKNLAQEVQQKRFREDLFYRLNVIPLRLPSLRDRKEDILPLAHHFLEVFSARYSKNLRGFSKQAAEWLLTNRWTGNVRELENAVERATVVARGDVIQLDDIHFEALSHAVHAAEENPPQAPQPASDSATTPEAISVSALSSVALPAGIPPTEDGTALYVPEVTPQQTSTPVSESLLDKTKEPITLAELEHQYIREVVERCNGVKERAARILGIDRKTLYRKLQDAEESASIH
jgi:two-component system response regulator HydG